MLLFRRRRVRAHAAVREATKAGVTVLDRRLPLAESAKVLLRKAFPDHWSFLLGEIALYSFVVLVLTGTWLTLFFEPGTRETLYQGSYVPLDGLPVSAAYDSTLHISFEVRGGLLVRQMHHWGALVFLAAISVHLLRIFFTGAFRRPREFNWMIGVLLFLLALLEGFCGYSLPDDLLSGTGLRTANTIVMSIPVVGTYLAFFLWGGSFPGHLLNQRLYIMHVLFVPGALIALITLHLILVFYLKHTQWSGPGRTNSNAVGQPMFPHFIAKSTGLFFIVTALLAALGAVAQINPVWAYGPYRADQVSTGAQPDWYVGFLEGAMRLMPPWQTTVAGHTVMWNVLLPAVVLPGILFTLLFCYPVVERWITGDRGERHLCDRPRDAPVRTAFGVAAVVAYAVLLAAGGNDVTAFSFHVSVNALTWIFRVGVFLFPVLAFMVTKRLCLALQEHEQKLLTEGEETGEVTQKVYGALVAGRTAADAGRLYRFVVRDLPVPEPPPGPGAPRRVRLRAAVNRWYFRHRVSMPLTPEQSRHVEDVLAQPERKAP
ncbi:cytochrome bc1 complex cytochrome b subunit [Actinacidiphila bryophytorum]|uniref:cytochrome bc1 complex cytochrome b subunit n=1 Tax=Actinacidiphila bryophytorum TaxID=1436133 RepID=UPI002176D832|nr:ubiquinol-cytochrome c reductase cytochrome b subunit [Actinacidiphila bryophytorum]UWE10448.1 ubiquinol-cytochrome c reductase cytochrome b subunit [Actinacidiphila bryophytorum]